MKKIAVPVLMTAALMIGGGGLVIPELAHATTKTKQSVQKTSTYKTTTDLNLRSGAGTSHKKLLTIPKGQTVKYISKSGSWYKVSYKKKTGYVLSSYLKKTETLDKKPANTKWISKASAEKILMKEYKKRTNRSYVYERHDRLVTEVLFQGTSSAKADLIVSPFLYLGALDTDASEVGEENYKEWKKVLEIFNKKITIYAITQIDEKYANDFLKEVQKFALTSKRKDVVVKRIGGKDFVFKNTGEFVIEPK